MEKRTVSPEFGDCLKRNKIREFSQGKNLVDKELLAARTDLSEAKDTFQRDKFKWAIIQAYYSMFHSARALLYNQNYRERSHHCLIVALKSFYVEKGKLSVRFLEGLQKAKTLRENADYYDQWSQLGAKEMVALAGEFLNKAESIL
ncbi:MAG: HEPN domain-containing protein [Candidatus Omnitrophica bacterium]|nr:HEPN domain-containing protein [Candidatus Omnitrophota bacterium]